MILYCGIIINIWTHIIYGSWKNNAARFRITSCFLFYVSPRTGFWDFGILENNLYQDRYLISKKQNWENWSLGILENDPNSILVEIAVDLYQGPAFQASLGRLQRHGVQSRGPVAAQFVDVLRRWTTVKHGEKWIGCVFWGD